MKFYRLVAIATFFSFSVKAQLITYFDLSFKYIYKIRVVKVIDIDSVSRRTNLTLYILDKHKKLIQKINIVTDRLYDGSYKSDTLSRSYVTGKNAKKVVLDYDFGDIIVADINFDNKEDLVIKTGEGGNGGPEYRFYLQDINNHFYIDNYLTTYVGSFPKHINSKKKTITTQIHATCCLEGRKTFKYNVITHRWHLIKWIMVK